jgi:hypothetical protein
LRLIKAVFGFIVFLAIAVAFFWLIRFEISYGVAGGKFGGASISDSPGTFWFLIELQMLMGLYSLVNAIKEPWDFSHRNTPESDQKPPASITAVYWLSATVAILVLCLLGVWSVVEMLYNMYTLLENFEMPKRAILGGMFLICMIVFGNIIYMFLIRGLIDTLIPKARISFQTLRKAMKA